MKFSEMPYKRVDVKALAKEIGELTEKLKAAKTFDEAKAVHEEFTKAYFHGATMLTLAQIRSDIDTTDEFYSKEHDYYDENGPLLNEPKIAFSKALLESPFKADFEKLFGPVSFANMEIEMRSFDPKMVTLMQEENALINEYNKLMASAKIEWEGEIYNFSLMTKFTTDPDRDVRIKANKAVEKQLLEFAPKLDELYDKLVKNRTAQAKILGYDIYTKLGYDRMSRNNYGPEEVKVFREEVKKKIVPLACKIYERKRERLGLDKLYYYDSINFKNGDPCPIGTPEEILENGQKMYAELSPETKEFFDYMMENQLFDVLGRKTKKAGGYMTSLYDFDNCPFIFANFNGTQGDINVVTHEAGHAFQGFITRHYLPEKNEIGMETAEIHSMSMEFFTLNWMDKFFGDRADDYKLLELEGAITFIPYGCMVDEFQHIAYENPDMTPAERKAAWIELEQQYRPMLDFADNKFLSEGGWWQRQLHIYNYPFYYIDYCLAQTVALQYKAWMDTDYDAAWASYLKLCKLSGGDFYQNMLREVGLKVPFEAGCLDETVRVISEKLGL